MASKPNLDNPLGCTPYKNVDVDETPVSVKAGPARLMVINAVNVAIAPRYLKLYNALVANVTVGTTVPVWTLALPAQVDANGGGIVLPIPEGLFFSTGLTIAVTTGAADNDTGAPGTKDVSVNLGLF
jgi:hypothetical protein